MNCKICGAYNDGSSKYCSNCGLVLGSDIISWKCPICETINTESNCVICGAEYPKPYRTIPQQSHDVGNTTWKRPEPEHKTYTPSGYTPVSESPVYPYPTPKKSGSKKAIPIIIGVAVFLILLSIVLNVVVPAIKNAVGNTLFEEYSEGELADTYYSSDFAGIKIEIPEDWFVYDDSELETMNEGGAVWEYMASSSTGASVGLCVEDAYLATITVRTYLEQLESMAEEAYKTEGIHLESTDITGSMNIAGELYNVFEIKGNINGLNVIQKYYVKKKGKYMISILITTYDDLTETQDELLTLVTKY